MRLHDIHSAELLPRFAEGAEWEQNALDSIIKHIRDLSYGLGAPYTMQAIEALSDEDLQLYYEQYGIAEYYPDLTRPTRNRMLYELARIYRYLGTPRAIETLCDYIFDDVTLDLKVHDNLAFDESGNLVDPSLLDVFDVEISPDIPSLSPDANKRILDNILKFSRNSQALRDLYFEFTEDFGLSISTVEASWDAQIVVDIENDSVCEPVGSESVDVLFGLKYSGNQWTAQSFSYVFNNNYWWSGFIDGTEKDAAIAIGCQDVSQVNNPCPLKNLRYSANYSYTVLGLYSDEAGEQGVADFDISDFYIADKNGVAAIYSSVQYSNSITAKTYRLRITKI